MIDKVKLWLRLILAVICCQLLSCAPRVVPVIATIDTTASGQVIASYRPLTAAEQTSIPPPGLALLRSIAVPPVAPQSPSVSFKKARIEIVSGTKIEADRGSTVANDSSKTGPTASGKNANGADNGAKAGDEKKNRNETDNLDTQGGKATINEAGDGIGISKGVVLWGVGILVVVGFGYRLLKKYKIL